MVYKAFKKVFAGYFFARIRNPQLFWKVFMVFVFLQKCADFCNTDVAENWNWQIWRNDYGWNFMLKWNAVKCFVVQLLALQHVFNKILCRKPCKNIQRNCFWHVRNYRKRSCCFALYVLVNFWKFLHIGRNKKYCTFCVRICNQYLAACGKIFQFFFNIWFGIAKKIYQIWLFYHMNLRIFFYVRDEIYVIYSSRVHSCCIEFKQGKNCWLTWHVVYILAVTFDFE